MLRDALTEVSQNQTMDEQLEKGIVRYCLGLESNKGMRATAKSLDLLRPLLDIKKERLDVSAYIQVDLRQALIDFYCRQLSVRDVLHKHRITLEDLTICVKHTSCRDLARLRLRAKQIVNATRMESIMDTHIVGYCRFIANRKMKFLSHHPEWKDDYEGKPKPSNYFSPVVAELMTAAWKASHKCLGSSKNESMLIASLKNSVRNHAVNLINQFTTAGRAVLVRTSVGVKGLSHDQFSMKVSSMDAPFNANTNYSLGDVLHGSPCDFQELLATFNLPPMSYQYAKLMLGVENVNFSHWASDFFGPPLQHFLDDEYESVVALYTGMTSQDKDDLQRILTVPN